MMEEIAQGNVPNQIPAIWPMEFHIGFDAGADLVCAKSGVSDFLRQEEPMTHMVFESNNATAL